MKKTYEVFVELYMILVNRNTPPANAVPMFERYNEFGGKIVKLWKFDTQEEAEAFAATIKPEVTFDSNAFYITDVWIKGTTITEKGTEVGMIDLRAVTNHTIEELMGIAFPNYTVQKEEYMDEDEEEEEDNSFSTCTSILFNRDIQDIRKFSMKKKLTEAGYIRRAILDALLNDRINEKLMESNTLGIRAAMAFRSVTVNDLAQKIQVSTDKVDQWIDGKPLNAAEIRLIADALNVDENWIAGNPEELLVYNVGAGMSYPMPIVRTEKVNEYMTFYHVYHVREREVIAVVEAYKGYEFETQFMLSRYARQPRTIEEIADCKWFDHKYTPAIIVDGLPVMIET